MPIYHVLPGVSVVSTPPFNRIEQIQFAVPGAKPAMIAFGPALDGAYERRMHDWALHALRTYLFTEAKKFGISPPQPDAGYQTHIGPVVFEPTPDLRARVLALAIEASKQVDGASWKNSVVAAAGICTLADGMLSWVITGTVPGVKE